MTEDKADELIRAWLEQFGPSPALAWPAIREYWLSAAKGFREHAAQLRSDSAQNEDAAATCDALAESAEALAESAEALARVS